VTIPLQAANQMMADEATRARYQKAFPVVHNVFFLSLCPKFEI
jgi:hypothetical protein